MSKRNNIVAILWSMASLVAAAQVNPTDHSVRVAPQVRVLSMSQMSREETNLLASRRKDLIEAAEFYGYNIRSGSWIASQIECPHAPGHLIMHYVELPQGGSLSLFTAIIPRGAGSLHIIPVLQHGTQVVKVFGSTEAQRDLINTVISAKTLSDQATANSEWPVLATCYAALAGAEPNPMSVTSPEEMMPILSLSPDGRVRAMRFTAVGPGPYCQDWLITFDRDVRVKSIGFTLRVGSGPLRVPAAEPQKFSSVDSLKHSGTHPVPSGEPLKSKPVPAGRPLPNHPVQ